LLGAAFWFVYVKPRGACGEDSGCTPGASGKVTKTVLWLAAGLALLAATVNFWAPLFY
jgi:mercuric ion transport protein